MRRYISIGAVLVASVIAGGVAAGLAAPNFSPLSADRTSARAADKEDAATVDVELALAVDVSYSMDMDELAVQREGYAQAIVSKEFLQALKSLPNGKISITYFEWAASSDQKIIIPWRVIDGPETADAVAEEILKAPIRRASTICCIRVSRTLTRANSAATKKALAATIRTTSTMAAIIGSLSSVVFFISETSALLWIDSLGPGPGSGAVAPCPGPARRHAEQTPGFARAHEPRRPL